MLYLIAQHTKIVSPTEWIVWLAAAATVIVCVLIHYEVIRLQILMLRRFKPRPRLALPGVVLGLILTHVVEVALFALSHHWVQSVIGKSKPMLAGAYEDTISDSIYFSMTVYTTVGFGDITPTGPLRILVGIEALTGLVLITWSASFTFLVMERYYRDMLQLDDLSR